MEATYIRAKVPNSFSRRMKLLYGTYIKVCFVTTLKVLKIKRQTTSSMSLIYLLRLSYIVKTYTTMAREPSIHTYNLVLIRTESLK